MYRDGAGSWNLSLWKTRSPLFYIVDTMAVVGLAKQGASESTDVVLTISQPHTVTSDHTTVLTRYWQLSCHDMQNYDLIALLEW